VMVDFFLGWHNAACMGEGVCWVIVLILMFEYDYDLLL
jgi:hypothetical protein